MADYFFIVMVGLAVPAIHVFELLRIQDVDARHEAHEAGHDKESQRPLA
jgi:hypothetical protein